MDFKSNYDRRHFIKFLGDFLPNFTLKEEDFDIERKYKFITSVAILGKSEPLGVDIYEISHLSENDPRVTLSREAFTLLKDYASRKSLVVFKSENSKNYRLSLITFTSSWESGKKVKTEFSNPRRYSFYLGPDAKINTPYKFLIKQGPVMDIEDLKRRFSLEVVNKDFYKLISESYMELVGRTKNSEKNEKTYSPKLRLPSIEDHSQTSLEFGVRLIGRIIFCWFLREKKSESGLSLMPRELLSLEAVNHCRDYYHTILEPIFFEVLNKPIKLRKDEFLTDSFTSVPYLNGGLFTPQDDDFYKRTNGDMQSQFYNTLVIPDEWFKAFFETLETYNFTIDENTSFDEELSIDPEMLGRIFENLLAEINPETGESARKSTGSYYTPRSIVSYMIDESLLIYLMEQTKIEEAKLRVIISYDLTDDSDYPLNPDEKEKVVNALEKIKILDPACGSGAFPIGALQKIVFILQLIDPDGQLWFRKQLLRTSPEIRRVIEREFENQNFDYIRKLGIIRENIYGIDIQPIATEISRLRCFLTLIVDQSVQDSVENRGIEPLPNLDFKFVTANSLLGLPVISDTQQDLFDDTLKIDQLKDLRNQFFNARGEERATLIIEFSNLQTDMINELIDKHGYTGAVKAELTRKLTDWKPFKHKSTDWFDPEWMFGIRDGFDLILGNPPYSRIQGIDKTLVKKYKNIYKSATGKFDLYVLFVERGLNLATSESGQVNYIMPHKWTNASYGKGLREFTLHNKYISKLISFGAYQVFNASTYTSLVWFKRTVNENVQFNILNKDLRTNTELDTYLRELRDDDFTKIASAKLGINPWTLANANVENILDKLRKQPLTINSVFKGIYQGIVTTGDDIFYVKGEIKGDKFYGYSGRLQRSIVLESTIVKPLLMGDDIDRYSYKLKNKLYVIYPHYVDTNNKTKPYEEEELESLFPMTYEYLSNFKSELTSKKIKYKTNSKYWYALHRSREIDLFEQEKIITPYLSIGSSMTIDKQNYYTNAKCYCLIKKESISESYKFYLAIFNSNLLWFYLKNTGTMFRGGYFAFTSDYLDYFPLPKITDMRDIGMLEEKVDQIFLITSSSDYDSNNPSLALRSLENEINQMVYRLYGLTAEERKIVETEQ